MRHGIDRVTIAQLAEKADVSASTIYAVFGSKAGILRTMMRSALFGERFQTAVARLSEATDPVQSIARTAEVSRAVYEAESSELGLLRGATAFSPALRSLEEEFEELRYDMQKERVEALYRAGTQKDGLALDEARRVLWMYTSRDVFRLLVNESGWTPERYQVWLSETLVNALVAPRHASDVVAARKQDRERHRLRPVGTIRSALKSLEDAPRQGTDGAPDAWIEVRRGMQPALEGLVAGDRLIVITWLHEADRAVLRVHPRSDESNPLTGVFATRSPDRPNPLGLHTVTLRAIKGRRLLVGPIEAIDGTPVVDIKPVI